MIQRFPLEGVPSRTRGSRDGAMAGATVFVAGDSYTVDTFSTRTTLFDLRVRRPLVSLEEFSVEHNGRPFKSVDFKLLGCDLQRRPGPVLRGTACSSVASEHGG